MRNLCRRLRQSPANLICAPFLQLEIFVWRTKNYFENECTPALKIVSSLNWLNIGQQLSDHIACVRDMITMIELFCKIIKMNCCELLAIISICLVCECPLTPPKPRFTSLNLIRSSDSKLTIDSKNRSVRFSFNSSSLFTVKVCVIYSCVKTA